ncbi:MAG TPA: NADH-quinone oxidoreductase subunit J [Aggregatilineales bacterium]|nr:NADH-quinone oxidoreductase subunit J [Aggregatilineales bacterium]
MVLFIIFAAVAIFAAALMLISQNPVHSALFLVVNLLCVSFFYLMLNAPFLSMIQVTVYAGAIMVLFMFVIMLLGAERLRETQSQLPWIAPGAVALTTIFLVVVFIGLTQGNIGFLKPVVHDAQVRFVQVAAGVPTVDVYVGDTQVAKQLDFRGVSDFTSITPGDYQALLFPSCTETDPARCVDPIKANAAPIFVQPLPVNGDTTTTFVIAGTPDALQLLSVPTDLSAVSDDAALRLTAVNALPGTQPVTLVRRNPSVVGTPDPKETDPSKQPYVPITDPLKFGDASKTLDLTADDYLLEWRQGDKRVEAIPAFTAKGRTDELIILAPIMLPGAQNVTPQSLRLDPARTQDAFGSPQQIGTAMLSTYLLPFELVSLLLLAAMVGAILMTREEVVRRVRQRLVISPAARRINAAMVPANPRSAGNEEIQEIEAPGD